jgi:DNA-binding response OmpR family regulator
VNQMTHTRRVFGVVDAAPMVLVVDDYPALADVVCTMLESAGYDVWAAESAEAALRLLSDARWDALVTDLNMPGLSGMDLLRRRDIELPAVLMSAQEPHGLIFELRSLNAVWLQKPFSPAQLINLVAKAARRSSPPATDELSGHHGPA